MLRIDEPFHGAVLNHRHGRKVDGGLRIVVRGHAAHGDTITVNGERARRIGEQFETSVILRARETDIAAVAKGPHGVSEHRVRVVWDRNSRPRYRFSIDDNIFFLRDIAREKRRSLFDCFYLKLLRDLNRKYGAKFAVNLFYATPDGDFDLSQFPSDYRNEWADCASWLKLTFHARAEFPDRPYQHASAEELAKDYDQVAEEVQRFAGAASWTPPTVIHWAMVHPQAMPALVKRGVKVLSGFFAPDTGTHYTQDAENIESAAEPFRYDVNYWLDNARCEYLQRHDALKDFDTGIVYSRSDIVCNNCPVEQVVPTLDPLTRDPNTAEIMDLFTHEQYFWPFYFNYRPDHAERCEAAIRFCTERGYEPVLFSDGFLGADE